MGTVLYLLFLILFLILYYPVFVLIWLVTLPFDPKQKVFQHACRFFSTAIFRCCPFWTVRVQGREFIDRKKAYVVVSNHQSMFDIPLLFVLPLNFKFVSKKEVYRIPVFGLTLWLRRDVAIERGGTSSTKRMLYRCKDLIRKGLSVVIFPEGTRTRTGRIERFKEGAFMVAKTAGADLLPVVIEGNYDMKKEKGFGFKMPHRFTVRILEPVPAETVRGTDIRTLSARVHERMLSVHRNLAPQYYDTPEKEQ